MVEQADSKVLIQQAIAEIQAVSDDFSVDHDIREIFIEEAEEVLQSLTSFFAVWLHHADDQSALKDIRRAFHTLKGSGRMAGANHIAELAWSMENMLNRLLDGNISVSLVLVQLMQHVVALYPNLIKEFANLQKPTINIIPFMAVAHLLTKGIVPELQSLPWHATESLVDKVPTLQSAAKVTSSAKNDVIEPENLQIFVEEAEEHLETIHRFLAKPTVESMVPDDLIRSLHTLRGSAGMSGVLSINQLASVIEEEFKRLIRQHLPVSKQHYNFLEQFVQCVGQHLEVVEHGEQLPLTSQDLALIREVKNYTDTSESEHHNEQILTTQGLVTRLLSLSLDELLDAEFDFNSRISKPDNQQYISSLAVQSRQLADAVQQTPIKALSQLTEILEKIYSQLDAAWPVTLTEDDAKTLHKAQEALTAMFDALAASQQPAVPDDLLNALEGLASQHFATKRLESLPDDRTEPSHQSQPIDEELLEIFLEEADELIEDIDQSFERWQKQPTEIKPLKSLQRYLHTLKGGARMIGLTGLGDLAHELEAVYEKLLTGTITIKPTLLKFMRHAQDVMAEQIEELRHYGTIRAALPEVTALSNYVQSGDESQLTSKPNTVEKSTEVLLEASQSATKAETKTPSQSQTSDSNFFSLSNQKFDIPVLTNSIKTHLPLLTARSIGWSKEQAPQPEIMAQFIREAGAYLLKSDHQLNAWLNNTDDKKYLFELQHDMQSLQMGAQAAGVPSIAQMAEELELVYATLTTLNTVPNTILTQLLLVSQQWLKDAVTVLKQQLQPVESILLLQTLQKFQHDPDSLISAPYFDQQLQDFKIDQAYTTVTEEVTHKVKPVKNAAPPSMQGAFEKISVDAQTINNEVIRVSSTLMEKMINLTGENAINRARIEMNIHNLKYELSEMSVTIQRLAEQLRRLDGELEVHIRARHEQDIAKHQNFDPLEMDHYSSLNQLSRSLAESTSDLLDFKTTLVDKIRDTEDLLLQQSRIQSELQDNLLTARLVPFYRLVPRLQRVVRQTAADLGKSVELIVENAEGELDRTILEHMIAPLEHMLRNAIDHGLESIDERLKANKPAQGIIRLQVTRQGNEIVIQVADDGRGISVEAVRQRAIELGLITDDSHLRDHDIMQLIFHAGLSTAEHVTQISGRGVGLDVVQHEIKLLGGAISVDSTVNKGTEFTIRLPLTVAVTDALIVRVADQQYAIPLTQIDRIVRVSADELTQYYQSDAKMFAVEGQDYRLHYLGEFIQGIKPPDLLPNSLLAVLLIKGAGQFVALQVDQLIGSRAEILVKPAGQQLASIPIIAGATIMGDGAVVIILDAQVIARQALAGVPHVLREQQDTSIDLVPHLPKVMVVDDSVTVRKVTTRLLERHGYEVLTAKDGMDAMTQLQTITPDIMLLDIEMPRMDGYEVLSQIRHSHSAILSKLPVIMITSRTGEKHRHLASEMDVNDYLGKPFQEQELLQKIEALLDRT